MSSYKTQPNLNKKQKHKAKANTKQMLIISVYLIFSLLITNTFCKGNKANKNDNNNNIEISGKEDLKKLVEALLSEEMPKTYKELNRAEQLFHDIFIQRMVDSYNYTDFSPENLKKYLTAETIQKQKELAFEDFSYKYHIIEDELKDEIKKNSPKPDDFYDDDLSGEDDTDKEDSKYGLEENKGKNEL